MNGDVYALTVFDEGGGPALYAGGNFTTAGGVSANRVAKWDGVSWSPLGSGLDGGFPSPNVYAFTVFDDGGGPALYAGGYFFSAGGVGANHIARWDGVSWSALGSGTSYSVYALTVFDDGGGPSLYAGGIFNSAGGVSANRIARWDGSNWSALGAGLPGDVYALTVFDDGGGPALYAGGNNFVAKWNGASWSFLGTWDKQVNALTTFDDGGGPALYAGTAGVSDPRVTKWDGASWWSLGLMDGPVHALTTFDDGGGPALYAGGAFTAAGGKVSPFFAKSSCTRLLWITPERSRCCTSAAGTSCHPSAVCTAHGHCEDVGTFWTCISTAKSRFFGVVVQPAFAGRQSWKATTEEPDSEEDILSAGRAAELVPGTFTALRVTLTTLNNPRFCCSSAAGTSCSTTPCNLDAHCYGVPGNSVCAHQSAPGRADYAAFEGKIRYVNSFPGGSLLCPGKGPPFNQTFRCATLGCDPEYRDWATDLAMATNPPSTPGLLYISGDAAVPSSTLDVSQIAESCGAAPEANTCLTASYPLKVQTGHWGDITSAQFGAPDGKSDVLDIPAVVNYLKDIPTFPEERTWLKQRVPRPDTDAITVIDLSDVVDAGPQGGPYPASRTIDSCPHD